MRRWTAIATAAVCAFAMAGAAPADAVPIVSLPDPDRPHYTAEVDIDVARRTVRGRVEVRFTPDLATDRLVWRLWPAGPGPAATEELTAVTVTTADGTDVTARSTRDDATTVVTALSDSQGRSLQLAPRRSVVATAVFTIVVPGLANERVSIDTSGVRLGSFLPVLAWEPRVGWNRTPAAAAHGEASMSPTADFDVAIRTTPPLDVLATGARDGDRWRAVAVREFALSAGRLRTATSTVRIGGRRVVVTAAVGGGIAERPEPYARRATAALLAMSNRYGDYPWDTLSLVVLAGVRGGIEYPTHVMLGPRTSTGRVVPHEVAHQWFYALLGNDQGRDPWIDEGLATWAETRLLGTTDLTAAQDPGPEGAGRAGAPMAYWDMHPLAYQRGVYSQTVAALASLGDPDAVDAALHGLVDTRAYGIATSEDVVAALTAQLPDARTRLAEYGINGRPAG